LFKTFSFGPYTDALFTRHLRHQLHSVQGRVKCPTDAASVPQRSKLVTGTRAARSSSE